MTRKRFSGLGTRRRLGVCFPALRRRRAPRFRGCTALGSLSSGALSSVAAIRVYRAGLRLQAIDMRVVLLAALFFGGMQDLWGVRLDAETFPGVGSLGGFSPLESGFWFFLWARGKSCW